MATIDANPASGTRDYLPAEVSRREEAFARVREVFRRHGFSPLDTPAFERLEVLTGKYGDEGDQLIFKILRRGEHEQTGQADLALRYDLTVPLARVVARYGSQLPQPFKRYQIAPVWRADRPGRGRFREFTQCDLDTVGTSSLVADAATIEAVADAIVALGVTGFRIQINHRQALAGLVEAYGIPDAHAEAVLVSLDKLGKIGVEGVAAELREQQVDPNAVDTLVVDLGAADPRSAIVDRVEGTERGRAGLEDIGRLMTLLGNVEGGTVEHVPVLARGLSYYTGPVFEVVHDSLDATIAAGGRYDGLIGMFQGHDVPATGGSLGLERLLLLVEDGSMGSDAPDVVVAVLADDLASDAMRLARRLRGSGIHVDLYTGEGRLGKQLKYADRRGARIVVIQGPDERDAGTVTVKTLMSGAQATVPDEQLAATVASILAG